MADRTEPLDWQSATLEEELMDFFIMPLDSAMQDVSNATLISEYLLWPDPEMFAYDGMLPTDTEDLSCSAIIDADPAGLLQIYGQDAIISPRPPYDISVPTTLVECLATPAKPSLKGVEDEIQLHHRMEFVHGQKRFEECLHEFESGRQIDSPRRKRRKFSFGRRKEVSQMRKVGACIRCKLTKSSCKLDFPCPSCIKASGDPHLGRVLCVRQSLLHIRFATDLWHRSSDIKWLEDQVAPLVGIQWTIEVFLKSFHPKDDYNTLDLELIRQYMKGSGSWKRPSPLEIRVQPFVPRQPEQHTMYVCEDSHSGSRHVHPQCYAIPSSCLPSLSDIDAWALDTMCSYPSHESFGGFRASFLSLARTYYESEMDLPLKELLQKAVQLSALHCVKSRVLSIRQENPCQLKQYASIAVHVQLAVIITQGIIDLEIEILSSLQRLIFGSKGPGKGNMVPICTCLWLLILMYRETVDSWFPEKHEIECPQLARQLYDMLVSIYSGLFGSNSPLRLNWLIDDVYALFGRDSRLTQSLGTVKTEFALFDKIGGHRHKKDALLRSLIFEREMKGLTGAPDPLAESYYRSSIYEELRITTRDLDTAMPLDWFGGI